MDFLTSTLSNQTNLKVEKINFQWIVRSLNINIKQKELSTL